MKVKGKHTNEMFDSLFVCSLLKIRDIYDTQKNGESQDFENGASFCLQLDNWNVAAGQNFN